MFLSTSHNKIDKKGRVSVPAPYRNQLEIEGGSLILFKSLQFKCLEGTSIKRMKQYVDAIDELDAMSNEASILRMMMADSFDMRYDSEGRIVIPETLISYAILGKTAVFMGIGRSFLIWSESEYQNQYKNTQNILIKNGPPKLILKPNRNQNTNE